MNANKPLTTEEVEDMGFYKAHNSALKWSHPKFDKQFYIYSTSTIWDLFNDIFEMGVEEGIKQGKNARSKEISELLKYTNDETY